ncbi:MAG: hypothetical protein KDD66_14205 [Bdellovibrionales bacterium]|nr:hypothetical protein [Bdellovibrionales bacterium]
MSRFKATAVLTSCLFLLPGAASALTTDQGGYAEKYKGGGDKVPPRCGFDVPTSASEPFFIRWNCADNFEDKTPQADIRTSVWIRRESDTRWVKIQDFLGLPASLWVDHGMLGVSELDGFEKGLPVSFRLIATDNAGITSTSPVRTVSAGSTVVEVCNLTITTAATESTGSTTGIPSMTAQLVDAQITSAQTRSDAVSFATNSDATASPCEIDSVCSNSSMVGFSGTASLAEDGSSDGNIQIVPGLDFVALQGTYQTDSSGQATSLNLSGETVVDGLSATVTLSCGNS